MNVPKYGERLACSLASVLIMTLVTATELKRLIQRKSDAQITRKQDRPLYRMSESGGNCRPVKCTF